MDQDPTILDMFDVIESEKSKAEQEREKKQKADSGRKAPRRGR